MDRERSLARDLSRWCVYCLAAPAAAMEMISLNSLFAGYSMSGSLPGFGFGILIAGVGAFLLIRGRSPHEFLSRLSMVFSTIALLGLFAFRGKVLQLQESSGSDTQVAFTPILLVLLVQLALAAAYMILARRPTTRRRPAVPWWAWAPVASFVPILLIGGFTGVAVFGWGPDRTATSDSTAGSARIQGPAEEEFSRFYDASDFEFAHETARVGEDFGGSFAHYHTGGLPLLGIAFSQREWHREERISKDLRGIFDREAAVDAEHVLLGSPEYIVTGLQVQGEEHVQAIRVEFSLPDPSGGPAFDSYWSDWAGAHQRGAHVTQLGGHGAAVMGITGTSGLVVNSLGILIEGEAGHASISREAR